MAVNNRNHAVIIQVLNILYNEADGTDDVDGGTWRQKLLWAEPTEAGRAAGDIQWWPRDAGCLGEMGPY